MAIGKPSNRTKPETNNESGVNSPSGTQGTNKKKSIAGSKHECYTESYISDQIQHNWPDLDVKEKAFADKLIENGYDHREAAHKVGFKRDRGISLTRKPLIRQYIIYVQEELGAPSIVTKNFIDAKLEELYEFAVGSKKVDLISPNGSPMKAKKFNGGLALGILQERTKINGLSSPFDKSQPSDNPLGEFMDSLRESLTKNV